MFRYVAALGIVVPEAGSVPRSEHETRLNSDAALGFDLTTVDLAIVWYSQ